MSSPPAQIIALQRLEQSQKSKVGKLVDRYKEKRGYVICILSPSGVGLWGSTGANGRLDDCHSFKISNRMIARS
jgi:formylmethanofuran dehydrogenase subunit A